MADTDDRARVDALERRLQGISAAEAPDHWALAAYRLAVAIGEDATVDRERSLRRALALLERAGLLLDAGRAPVEHGRILNARGATWRALGSPSQAIDAFRQAADLLRSRSGGAEIGSVLSNLGLAQLESGEVGAALGTFDEALSMLHASLHEAVATGAEGASDARRAYASAALNRAQTVLAIVAEEDWRPTVERAVASIEDALRFVSVEEAPLQVGMLHHTRGLISMRADHPLDAADDFTRSLAVFTRQTFPFQFAIASFNRGRAHEQGDRLREALLDYESAAQLFDPRLHRDQWVEAARRLAEVEQRLAADHPGQNRSDHVVALLLEATPSARVAALRNRIGRQRNRAADIQRAELRQLAEAALRVPLADRDVLLRCTIALLMELPDDILRSGLLAQLDALDALPDEDRRDAHLRFDAAIQQLVMGPQRVRMRDILYEAGWDRP